MAYHVTMAESFLEGHQLPEEILPRRSQPFDAPCRDGLAQEVQRHGGAEDLHLLSPPGIIETGGTALRLPHLADDVRENLVLFL